MHTCRYSVGIFYSHDVASERVNWTMMDHSDLILCSFMENSICRKRVKENQVHPTECRIMFYRIMFYRIMF